MTSADRSPDDILEWAPYFPRDKERPVSAPKGSRPSVLRKHPNRGRARSSLGARRGAETPSKRRDAERFVLYVEGARDREILQTWARRLEPCLVRCVEKNTVILGGRQPARALSDFRERGGADAGWQGLVVLDRDDHEEAETLAGLGSGWAGEAGIELFVWSLRHIESYLLVPGAIRRVLGGKARDPRVDRMLARPELASRESRTSSSVEPHAKRMLGSGGVLSEALGTELRAGAIARAMRREELHPDIHALFGRIGALSGLIEAGPEVVIRTPLG